jgi:hypothetical protein
MRPTNGWPDSDELVAPLSPPAGGLSAVDVIDSAMMCLAEREGVLATADLPHPCGLSTALGAGLQYYH